VPLIVAGNLIGVLDIDSASINRFAVTDQEGVEKLCATFCELQSTRDQFI
jgi:putative methionine-R-sulfoxide reductase with GAF domain